MIGKYTKLIKTFCALVGEIGCRETEKGIEYIGAQNVTTSGKVCKEWLLAESTSSNGNSKYDSV